MAGDSVVTKSKKSLKQTTSKTEDPVTSIYIHESTKKMLEGCSRLGESYEIVIRRILLGMNEVYFDILNIDGEPPVKHAILFKLGNTVQIYDHGTFKEVPNPVLVVAAEP